MPKFTVTWTMDIDDAKSHQDAARQALQIQRDPESIATVFDVSKHLGAAVRDIKEIDLSAIDSRIEELEAIEQPLEVIEAGNGGDFGMIEYNELHRLREQ
jgi:hypothetical protein